MFEPVQILLQKLVQINSVTPSLESGSPANGGEESLAQWVKQFLESYHFHCELDYVEPGRPNIIARHRFFDPELPTVAFEAHLDTVDVERMSIDPFAGAIYDNALWGRGACDVKGTMAAMLTALVKWTNQTGGHHFNPIFIGTMGEENGTIGARHLARQGLPLDMILVGEPTSLNPVVGHKGIWRFAIETKGLAGHSSRPEQGRNAVEAMIPVLNALQNRVKPKFESTAGNTLSVTLLHGGTTINVIPDSCRLSVDARFIPGTKLDIVEEHISAMVETLQNNHPEFHYNFIEIQQNPPFKAKENSVLLSLLEETLAAHNVSARRLFEPWYSDAGHYSLSGYDVIVWGAGDICHAHTADEHIDIDQLQLAEQLLVEFLDTCEEYYANRC